jgi:hypothetical protein
LQTARAEEIEAILMWVAMRSTLATARAEEIEAILMWVAMRSTLVFEAIVSLKALVESGRGGERR